MKSIIISITTLLSIILCVQTTNAQISTHRNALTLKGLATDYYSPLNSGFDAETLTYGGELKYTRFLNSSFNLGFPIRFGQAQYPLSDTTTMETNFGSLDLNFIYKLNNGYMLKEQAFIAPYLFTGIGADYMLDLEENNLDAQVPVGLGFDIKLAKSVRLQLQSEYRFSVLNGYNDWQHTAGIAILLKGGDEITDVILDFDTDEDGISDLKDDCPEVPGVERFNGCPDSDGDNVSDADDQCPNEAGTIAGCPDTDRDGVADKDDECPEKQGVASNAGCPAIKKDTDRDGILDEDDRCPKVRGLTRYDGCPDNDGDGTPDIDDKCPTVIGTKDLNGCPDTDGDGVTDAEDECPTTPGIAEKNGCPEGGTNNNVIIAASPVLTTPTNTQPAVSQAITTSPTISTTVPTTIVNDEVREVLDFAMRDVSFETASDKLKVSSYGTLEKIAEIMMRYPEYNLSIEGHTDSQGDAERNQKLSKNRAKSCRDYLVKKGVEKSRMSYVGFGESQPIGDNNRSKGRAKNRRVEFKVYIR